ncbi:MAG: hypothetical protein K5891_09350, partial [Lachnospiraceae bacterium]|nr:hypothetical protein [Lachnospiraceae bacterium]
KAFGRCFSFSQSENVAMWMLYCRHPEDLMINISPRIIRKILSEKPSIELGKWDDGFIAIRTLSPEEYDCEFIDVLYCDEYSDETAIKRSGELVTGVNRDILRGFTYYKKSFPWNYENECRLVVTVDDSLITDGANSIKISVDSLRTNSKVYHSPQYEGENAEGYERSMLRGTMKWSR